MKIKVNKIMGERSGAKESLKLSVFGVDELDRPTGIGGNAYIIDFDANEDGTFVLYGEMMMDVNTKKVYTNL